MCLVLDIPLDLFLNQLHSALIPKDIRLHPQAFFVVALQSPFKEFLLITLFEFSVIDVIPVKFRLQIKLSLYFDQVNLECFKFSDHVVGNSC